MSVIKSVFANPVPDNDRSLSRQFTLWSGTYDQAPNPALSLEERFLTPMLSRVDGRDVLDVGCGTGRWLERMDSRAPKSLTGVDSSPEMLNRARRKLGRRAVLALGNATSLPIASSSVDVVLASFVVSYVTDLDKLAVELRRVTRAGGSVYITDLHPETAAACHWKRAFRAGEDHIEITTCGYSLEQVRACFGDAGFEEQCLLEPPFGLPELEIFRSAAKLDAFGAAEGLPGIYVLQLRPRSRVRVVNSRDESPTLRIARARIALDAELSVIGDVEIQDGNIASIITSRQGRSMAEASPSHALYLHGYMLLPGLINAHDHLDFGLYPNLGRGGYDNFADWARDIQMNERATIAAHRSVSMQVRLWWGAIRNLLSGVTTVCHHNPLTPEFVGQDFPVRVVENFGWAHSLSMDSDVPAKFAATSRNTPFIIHACEGLDETCVREIFELDRVGVLDSRTVLVHGLGLNAGGIALLNRRAAALVWCPTSNRFLFGRTHDADAISSIQQVLLGSDSPLTAAGDLLDEVHVANQNVGVSAVDLYHMLLDRAASVFRLFRGEGRLRPDGIADLIAVRDLGLSPAETVANLAARDVELVIVGGRVQLASERFARQLPPEALSGLRPLGVNSELRWIRAPLGRLFREAERVLGCELKIGGKRMRHVCTAWL